MFCRAALTALVLSHSARAQSLDLLVEGALGSALMLQPAFGGRWNTGLTGRAGVFELAAHSGVGVYLATDDARALSTLLPSAELRVLSLGQTRAGGWAHVQSALVPTNVQRCDPRSCRFWNWEELGRDAALTWVAGGGLWLRAQPYDVGAIDVVLGLEMVPMFDFVMPFPRLQLAWTLPSGFRLGGRLDAFQGGFFVGRQLRLAPTE